MEDTTFKRDWVDNVYREHSQRVFVTCLRFAGHDRQWALDRTHDVFIKLIEQKDISRLQPNPGAWLYRVAINTCLLALRQQRTRNRLLGLFRHFMPATSPSAEGKVRAQGALTELEEAINNLPLKQRAVMVLVHLENKSQNETAALLSLSKGQVSKLHSKAMAALSTRDWDADHV